MQKGDLKPPPVNEFAVNRIPNVKRVEYIKVEVSSKLLTYCRRIVTRILST